MTARKPSTRRCNDCGAPTEAGYYSPPDAPLPRAVRELLRDVVKLDYDEESPFTRTVDGWVVPSLDAMAQRAAKLLGTTPAAIVARARKVRK